jgi:dephospho-CoA kinase
MKTPVVIAVVGLPGAGKSQATTRFVKHQFVRIGFNDIFYEEFDRWGLERNENNEQYVRVEMRNKLGRTVLAERALPVIEQAVQSGKNVLIESLYAWWDYTFLRQRLGDRFQVLAIYAPPALRYARLAVRPERPYNAELAHCRDYSQIEAPLIVRSRQQTLWHADETRWLVFAMVEGKVGYRWYLWVFHGRDVAVFVLAAGRAHDVPEEHLGPDARGILVVDRYKAYQAIDQVKSGLIILAFCWAHVRRDFVGLARTWLDQEGWALAWVAGIGHIYALNDARLQVRDQPAAFAAADEALRGGVTALGAQGVAELADPQLHPARRKVLESLGDHWTGLTVFVEHPEVPMDNNTAERVQRGPVVGRKNYYGSGAVWAGRLAAMMFSLLQTLSLWNLNPRLWLTAYLEACAKTGGKAPPNPESFLPWHLSADCRQQWSLKGAKVDSDTS